MKLISLLSLGVLAVVPAAAAPFPDALDLGSHNRQSAWFDYFNDAHAPWYYHFDHGWLYVPEGDGNSLWMWDTGLGWVWTNPSIYPNVYEPRAGWLYYAKGSREPRYFLQRSSLEWMDDTPDDPENSYFPVPLKGHRYLWPYKVNEGKPMQGTFDGMSMQIGFGEYLVGMDWDGNALIKSLVVRGGFDGTAVVEGQSYAFEGNLTMQAEEPLERNALGIFTRGANASVTLNMFMEGQTFRFFAGARIYGLSELLLAFPWDVDLYELPVGTTFHQVLPQAQVSAYYISEVVGRQDLSESESYNFTFDPSPFLEMEIMAKHESYDLGMYYSTYRRVVEVILRQNIPDLGSGQLLETETRMWLAPGTGVIQMVEDNPFANEPLTIKLMEGNWLTPR